MSTFPSCLSKERPAGIDPLCNNIQLRSLSASTSFSATAGQGPCSNHLTPLQSSDESAATTSSTYSQLPTSPTDSTTATSLPAQQPDGVLSCTWPSCTDSFSKRWELKYVDISTLWLLILTHLSRHLKRHKKPFRCPKCNNGFRYRKDLLRHQGSKHRSSSSNTKIYACPVAGCGFATDRKDNCKRHVEKQHPMTLPCCIS